MMVGCVMPRSKARSTRAGKTERTMWADRCGIFLSLQLREKSVRHLARMKSGRSVAGIGEHTRPACRATRLSRARWSATRDTRPLTDNGRQENSAARNAAGSSTSSPSVVSGS
jgi:hypothetical protein